MSTPIPVHLRKAERGGTVYVVGKNGKAYPYEVKLLRPAGGVYARSRVTGEGRVLERADYLLPHEVVDRDLETRSIV